MGPVFEFELTEQHIKLLRSSYVEWGDGEWGAPCIDGKRPYGNSDLAQDMARKLDMDDKSLTDDDEVRLLELHQQTMTALQIVLVTGEFRPGQYRLRDIYDRRSWERVSQ
jgi:hypothetical protein